MCVTNVQLNVYNMDTCHKNDGLNLYILQLWYLIYLHKLCIINPKFLVVAPCNLTQIVSHTPGGTSTSKEIIITFYKFAQLNSGEPNTPSSSNTFSNSIPCVSNYPFVMGNHLTKKERNHVTYLLIKYENVFAFSMKDLGRCKTM